ncbi:SWIM zinc finger family protein [Roseateles chitinivorans]|uniref:SWIM zinc finger family protein n=1 Tax=Roseateles chitinivorans TaxID=2917965 RepID=UPI003D67FA71
MSLTMEGVLALAPDEASAKAARGLTSPAKWPLLGADDAAVWGECQGSGAKPYQTQVDLNGPAFRCSCPSRKFPCKHGLALLMLRAQDAARFTAAEPPAWVAEWIASRGERAQKKDERDQKAVERATERAAQIADGVDPAQAASALADPDNALRRESQRWRRIEDASAELQRWLGDQIGRGLGALDDAAIRGWRTMAARMVDAQAPGLGQRIVAAADGWRVGADWPERTLARLGLLQLACEGLARRGTLPEPVQADLRTVCGWPLDQAEVLATGERVTDRWAVLGVIVEEREGRLNERRVWLHGARSGRRAWLLDHTHGGRGFDGLWLPGIAADVTLAFYPGNASLRALAVDAAPLLTPESGPGSEVRPESEPEGAFGIARVIGSDAWSDEWQRVAERVAAHPFALLHPVVLANATPVASEAGPHLTADGRAVPLRVGDADWWSLMAVAGGHPLAVMGEWDGRALHPLTAWRSGTAAPAWTRSAA